MDCRTILFTLSLLFTHVAVLAQQGAFKEGTGNTITVFDVNGRIFENPNDNTTGSPYFMNAWKYGTIVLTNNQARTKRLLRVDCQQKQTIHYLSEKNVEMRLAARFVKELMFTDSAVVPAVMYRFQSGFPPVDNQAAQYRVL